MIDAATGTGKTLAAWMGPLIEWMDGDGEENPPLRVLWITPLRALVADSEKSLNSPLLAMEVPWSLSARTGDTKLSLRAKQNKRLPTALVITPESLAVLMARDDAEERFNDLRLIIVDEWHEAHGLKTRRDGDDVRNAQGAARFPA